MEMHCVLATISLRSLCDHCDATAFLLRSYDNLVTFGFVYCDHGDDTTRSLRSHGDCTVLLVRWRHHKTKSNISGGTLKVVKVVVGISSNRSSGITYGRPWCNWLPTRPAIVVSNPFCPLVPFLMTLLNIYYIYNFNNSYVFLFL